MYKIAGYATFEEAYQAAKDARNLEARTARYGRAWSVVRSTVYAQEEGKPFLALPTPELVFEAFGQRNGWMQAKEIARASTSGANYDFR